MKNLFKPAMIKKFIVILTFLLIIKLLWFVIQVIFLTAEDIDQVNEQSSKALYYRVKLTPNNTAAPQKVIKAPKKISGSINEITLLAIYNASDISVVTVLYKNKSKVLGKGDSLNGFILEGAGNNFAIFSKNNKNYKVLLNKKNKSTDSMLPDTQTSDPTIK
ncbi:MAG TPA: hypothetical protein EYG93_02240, partial [Sulfurospirillum arcachonense]|nr:hypothetical protein [Sulfurospirillum arcachonense]